MLPSGSCSGTNTFSSTILDITYASSFVGFAAYKAVDIGIEFFSWVSFIGHV
jgi:hypothetical protein